MTSGSEVRPTPSLAPAPVQQASSPSSERLMYIRGLEALRYQAALELPVTRRELLGWLLFEFAASAFQCLLYPFLFPILLQTLAAHQALRQSHPSTACPYGSCHLPCNPGFDRICQQLCTLNTTIGSATVLPLRIWNLNLNTSTFFQVVWGVGLLVLALTLSIFSPYVDYGRHQLKVMAMGSFLGAIACMLAIFLTESTSSACTFAAVLFVLAMAGAGIAEVAYNRYMGVIVKASEETKLGETETVKQPKQQWLWHRVSNRLSLAGTVAGALGAIMLGGIVYAGIVKGMKKKGLFRDIRLAITLGGLWWGIGTVLACSAGLQRMRQGPAFPIDRRCRRRWKFFRLLAAQGLAPYVISAGILGLLSSTVSWGIVLAIHLLASNHMCLSAPHLVGLAFLFLFSCAIFAPLAHFIQCCLSLYNRSMVAICLLLMSSLPIFFLSVHSTTLTFLHLAIAASMHGVLVGLLRSYVRTLFLDIAPVCNEGPLLSLLTFSEHAGAWFASLLILTTATMPSQNNHQYRPLFICSLSIICAMLLLVFFLDNRQGLVLAGHVKAENFDPDNCPVSSISTGNNISSHSSRKSVDIVDLLQKISLANSTSTGCNIFESDLLSSKFSASKTNVEKNPSNLMNDQQVEKKSSFLDVKKAENSPSHELIVGDRNCEISVASSGDGDTCLPTRT